MSIWVCGEVLIDILPTGPVVGGGPANTAKALARLGYEVDFIDGISTDAYGASARKELSRDGVGLGLSLTSDKPTCTATVTLDSKGSASYEFLIDGTATFDFNLVADCRGRADKFDRARRHARGFVFGWHFVSERSWPCSRNLAHGWC